MPINGSGKLILHSVVRQGFDQNGIIRSKFLIYVEKIKRFIQIVALSSKNPDLRRGFCIFLSIRKSGANYRIRF